MMDFLRRLAPVRSTDATRAVPVVPSRFAYDGAMAVTTPRPATGRSQPLENEDSLSVEDSQRDIIQTMSVSSEGHAAERPPPTNSLSSRRGTTASKLEVGAAGSLVQTASQMPVVPVSIPHQWPNQPRVDPLHAARSQASEAGPLLNTRRFGPPSVIAPTTRVPEAAPLSEAAVARRVPQTRVDNEVVHVTIGRIDVVANTLRAPALQSTSPVVRQPQVTLSDYLRSGSGGRR